MPEFLTPIKQRVTVKLSVAVVRFSKVLDGSLCQEYTARHGN